jgi:antitoxin (DNA-binding transcriptional repressor) of toxin-antitoxin stability system
VVPALEMNVKNIHEAKTHFSRLAERVMRGRRS